MQYLNSAAQASLLLVMTLIFSACSDSEESVPTSSQSLASDGRSQQVDNIQNIKADDSTINVPVVSEIDFSLIDTAQSLLLSMGLYQSESLAVIIDSLVDDIASLPAVQTLSTDKTIADNTLYGNSFFETEPVVSELFNCSGGGTMTRDLGITNGIGGSGGSADNFINYAFDQCEHQAAEPFQPGGMHSISGSLQLQYSAGFGRGTRTMVLHRWSEVVLSIANGPSYAINGEMEQSVVSSSSGTFEFRKANFDHYRKTVDGKSVESIEDVAFNYKLNMAIPSETYDLNAEGKIANKSTDASVVSVSSNPALSRLKHYETPLESEAFTGVIEFTAVDGSMLSLVANQAEQTITSREAMFVDLEYTSGKGVKNSMVRVRLQAIPNDAVSCLFLRKNAAEKDRCTVDGALSLP